MTISRSIHVAANGIILAVNDDLMLFHFHLISGQDYRCSIFYFSALSELFMSMFFEKKVIKLFPYWEKVILLTIIANFLTPFGTSLGIHSSIDYNSIQGQSEYIHSINKFIQHQLV